jgi:hypothetical protein
MNKVDFTTEKLTSILKEIAQKEGQITNIVRSEMVLATWG